MPDRDRMTDDHLEDFRAELMAHCQEMVDLLVTKRAGYGPDNLIRFGGIGIVIRANDKIQRLATMYQDGIDRNPDGDTMADAWRDLIGYGLLGLLFHEQRLTVEQKYRAGIPRREPASEEDDRCFWYCLACGTAYHGDGAGSILDCPTCGKPMASLDELRAWVRETPKDQHKTSNGVTRPWVRRALL